MPSFETRLISTSLDLPGIVLAFDLSNTRGDTIVQSFGISEAINRAPASYQAKQNGARLISKWWDAKAGEGSAPTDNPASFNGAGGASFLGGHRLNVSDSEAPTIAPSSFTIVAVSDHTVGVDGAQIFINGFPPNGLMMNVDDITASHHLTYAHAGGSVDTGVLATSGPHIDILVLDASQDKATWFRDGAQVFTSGSGYIATGYGGTGDDAQISAGVGDLGDFMLFQRVLSFAEIAFLSQVVGMNQFGTNFVYDHTVYIGEAMNHVPIATVPFTDPVNGSVPSRINTSIGQPQKYFRISKGAAAFVDVLILPIAVVDGIQNVDPYSGYVPHFLEMPDGSGPQTFFQPGDPPGVCRVRLRDYGKYLFEMYKIAGGMELIHFTLEP